MTKASTESRTVVNAAKGLIFASFILSLGMTSVPAFAGANIQMLPPVTEATKFASPPTPCPSGGAPNILTWDGTNPISCATGVSVSGGNVGIGTAAAAAGPPLDVWGATADVTASTYYPTVEIVNPLSVGSQRLIGMGEYQYNSYLQSYDSGTTYSPLSLQPKGGSVGIGSNAPIGNLDVEPTPAQAATSTPATICLNGHCTSSMGVITQAQASGAWQLNANGVYYAQANAVCPTGYVATGGGAYCDTAGGIVSLIYANPGSNNFYGSCSNGNFGGVTGAGSGNGVTATVNCTPSLPTLSLTTATASGAWRLNPNGVYYAQASAVCPAGYVAIGGGAYCDTTGGIVALIYSNPGPNNFYGSCSNGNFAGTTGAGTGAGVTATVICTSQGL